MYSKKVQIISDYNSNVTPLTDQSSEMCLCCDLGTGPGPQPNSQWTEAEDSH